MKEILIDISNDGENPDRDKGIYRKELHPGVRVFEECARQGNQPFADSRLLAGRKRRRQEAPAPVRLSRIRNQQIP